MRDSLLRGAESGLPGDFCFDPAVPITVTCAPGRLDVMGGIAAYSGSLAASTTIGQTARIALQRRSDALIRVASVRAGLLGRAQVVEVSLADIVAGPHGAEGLKRKLVADSARRWAAGVIGCYLVLLAGKYLTIPIGGANILVESDIPDGSGASESAAIEVATMIAINSAYGVAVPDSEIGALANRVENKIVGTSSELAEHMAILHGCERSLMHFSCAAGEITGRTALPADRVQLWGIDSGASSPRSSEPRAKARIAAFMGLRIVNHALSAAGERPNTHLCEVTPNRYRRDFAAQIPSSISGEEFLAWLGETGDPATRIDPDERYSVRAATEHAIYENHRVCRFVEQIATAANARSHTARVLPLLRAGELMYASHWSYSRIRLGSRETNVLVRIAREMGTAGGLYGARVTAAGLGGTMAVLTSGGDAARQCIRELSSRYADATGLTPRILEGGASCGARLISARIPSAPGSAGG